MSRTAFEWSQWTPPDPPSLDNTESKDGQKLLSLIRFMEKEEDEKEFEIKYEEAFNMFTNLIALSARHGILRGNYQRAEQILASTSTTGDNNRQGRPKNKKNRRKDDRKPDEKFTGESVSTDESLLISALLRIFALQGEKLKAMKPFVKLAADFCSSIADRLKAIPNITSSTVALAEYELMASSGVSLLRALAKINAVLLSDSTSQKEQDFKAIQILLGEIPAVDQRDEDIQILQSCLRATTTLISLFGTKLSRSTGLISDIRTVAWSTLTLPEEATQSAAAKLLATLPLAGAATSGDRSNPNAILSPAEQWSQALMDAVVAVSTLLKTMVPVSRKMSSEQASWDLTDGAKSVVEGSTAFFQQNLTSDEKIRCRAFRFLIGGFSSLILALLQRDYHGPGNEVSLLDTRICFDELLELLGTMLLFPSSSESLFYITKKRLRMEMMEGGVLSPMAIATEIGNPIKLHGHKVLHALFSALGGPVLLPYAKHLLRLVSASLFTSCSGPLRKVVDPVSTSQLEGTKRRWLHTSISLRSESIRTFTEAVSSFGLEPTRSSGEGSSWTSSKRSSNSEQCITLVGGCLLEQLTWEGEDTDDWGTLSERITLATEAAKSLQASLLSCGGFLSLTSRALIDSIATTGLKTIISPYQNEIASSSSIKVAMLEFGSSCLTTPWPNGASSSILEQLQLAASSCKADASTVSSTASATLRLCDTVSTPRVPALHVVTKKVDLSSSKAPVSSDMLLEGLQNAQEQISQNRAESKRDAFEEQENRNKRMKICESNQEKAEKKTALKTEGTSKDDCNGHPKPEEGKLNRESSSKDDNSDKQAAVQESPQVSGEQQLEVEDKSSSAANAQESAGGDASEDDDFLPGIVEDDGPDEDDV